jgi:hypothetical protein
LPQLLLKNEKLGMRNALPIPAVKREITDSTNTGHSRHDHQIKQEARMKSIHLLLLTTIFLVGFTGIVAGRVVRSWSYKELLEKSDVVVLATPTTNNDTTEHIDFPGFPGEHVIGVETKFAVSAVLKGDKALRDLVFHHYRTPDDLRANVSSPSFVSFDPVANPTIALRTFILFLIREPDGRYAPTVSQTDPGGAVRELTVAEPLKGKSIMSAEDFLKTVSQGSTYEKKRVIDLLARAYKATNRTSEQEKFCEMPNQFFLKIMSQPYEKTPLAVLYFSGIEALIDQLKTDERENAGIALMLFTLRPWPAKYDFWVKRWPDRKQMYIDGMNRQKPK